MGMKAGGGPLMSSQSHVGHAQNYQHLLGYNP